MTFEDYPDFEMLAMDVANKIVGELNDALLTGGTATLAVPGGTTPGPVFDELSAADLDWSQVRVVLTDERWVPESSARSNTRLVRERLLTGRAAAATMVPLYLPAETPEEVLERLTIRVKAALPLTVLILGMGSDMHTASLFPGADRLDEALGDDAPPVLPMRAPGAGEPRVTLTAPVLTGAMSTHLIITGAEKRAALDKARRLDPAEAPVALILGGATVHWAP